jgi:excisionase family DNA binding protein
MPAEVELRGLTMELTDDALEQLADALASDERFAELLAQRLDRHTVNNDGWLNVEQAAEYRGCPRSRIYELAERGLLEHRKDGRRLYTKREWLDEAFAPESQS